MRTIYLVLVEYDHEGYNVMRAFDAEADAEAFIEPFRAYMAKRPPYTYSALSSRHDSPEWAAYLAQMDAWERSAPEGFERGDGYSVMGVELYPCNPKGGGK